MPTPVTENPAYVDGSSVITDNVVTCVNTGTKYLYTGDEIAEDVKHEAADNPAGEGIGGFTQSTGRYKGTLTLQKIKTSDADPRGGFVLLLRGLYYKIVGAIGTSRSKNKVVTLKPAVEQIWGPVLTAFLSADGQVLTATHVAASTYTLPATGDMPVQNTRSGATAAFAIAAWTEEYPDAILDDGITIDTDTGILTATGVAAGTYYLKITVTDTVAGKPDRTGVGFLVLTLT